MPSLRPSDPPDPPLPVGADALAAIAAGRYRKQARFAPLGLEGQARLAAGRVLIVGCGATGSTLAETLVRAGVGLQEAGGWVRLADRDFVEASNLTRQTLYTDADAVNRTPKAIAAAERLAAVNGEVALDPRVEDVTSSNLERLAEGATLLLDGSDNFEARYLLNDYSLEAGVPWIYCGAVGGGGRAMPILPHRTACLRCLQPEPPPPGELETCDTSGVVLPAVNIAASFAAAFALKILAGLPEGGEEFIKNPHLLTIDAWGGSVRKIGTRALFESGECPACGGGREG
ncbi:MAG: ThiF family adenylyltransferase, partial [Planctomycetota bacterium]